MAVLVAVIVGFGHMYDPRMLGEVGLGLGGQ